MLMQSIPALAGALMIAAMSTQASATEWIECSDAAGEVQIGVLAGGVDFAEFSRAHLTVGDDSWSTDPALEPGTPLTIADSFFDWKQLFVTLTDADRDAVLAELRVFVVSNESGEAKGGVVSVPSKGVWSVTCEGP